MKPTEATFRELVARHQGGVLRVCRSILGDEHLGADAAQETFLRLWRRLTEGRGPHGFSGWLRAVAVSTSIDLARRRATEAERLDAAYEPTSRDATPPETASTHELEERLAAAVERLSEGQRTVFLLRHAGGLTLAEVAESIGVSLSTVKTQFARACTKLKDALETEDPPHTRA